jgi:uncharacterized protein
MELDRVVLARISSEAGVRPNQAEATIALLEEQSTVPFIARYRKEVTGNLDEVQIRSISERHQYYKQLLSRRHTILNSVEEQGKLNDELKSRLLACYEKNELEDLYLPYKPGRKTKASVAREKDLEPLAKFIWEQTAGEKSIDELAESLISTDKGVASREEALEGGLHIVAEWISEDLEIRKTLRRMILEEGVIVAKVAKGHESEKTKYDMYYDFREPISKIPSHRMLAVRRGFKEQILTFSIECDTEKALRSIRDRVIKDVTSPFAPLLEIAIRDSYERLLDTGIQTEVRALLKERSDSEAIKVFEANLSSLLLAAPAGPIVVVGIDPGFRTGCKIAVVDETGKYLDHATIYPTEPRKDVAGSELALYRLLQTYQARAIAVGNGTGSRETDVFVRDFLRKYQAGELFELPTMADEASANVASPVPEAQAEKSVEILSLDKPVETLASESSAGVSEFQSSSQATAPGAPSTESSDSDSKALHDDPLIAGAAKSEVRQERAFDDASPRLETLASMPSVGSLPPERRPIFCVIVNESGASVYSASEGARREFPRLDLTVRGAVSIARRLQDPLAELVKIHPKSIGVGQYQHDVDQKKLKQGLEATVESCVNRVGVDLNTASYELLRYVSGVNQRLAKAMVEHRHHHGRFRSRSQLTAVNGFGEKTYEQAAGFLRIKGGDNPLDATAVHPESYEIVDRMAASLGLTTAELIQNSHMIEKLDLVQFGDGKGLFTLNDIKEELLKPGRDPREQFAVPVFRDDVKGVSDLREGMVLEGTVSNVTNFGAFVDVGVHQDGLVHVSELSNRFVKDPREAVHVGEVVKVKVIGVDVALKRISLSMKALLPKPKRVTSRKAQAVYVKSEKRMARAAEAGVSAKGEPASPVKAEPSKQGPLPAKSQPRKSPALPDAKVRPKPAKEKQPSPAKKPEKPSEPALSFADKIRMLQEKFGGIR